MKLYKHEDFKENDKDYKFYEELFEGDPQTMVNDFYLPRHQLESIQGNEGSRKARLTRQTLSKYTNFPQRIFKRYQSIMFQVEPVLDEKAAELLIKLNLLDNIDGYGTPFNDFIKENIFKNRFIYGDTFLLTTSDGERIIWDCINPRGVPDYQFTKGQLSLFRYEYEVYTTRTSSQQEPKEELYSDEYSLVNGKVILTRYKAKEYPEEGKEPEWMLLSQDEITNFEGLPVGTLLGDSFIKSSAPDILTYHNLKSSLLNQIYHQAYQKIVISGNVDDNTVLTTSEYTFAVIKTTDGTPATVTVIEPSNPQALIQEKNATEINIMKAAFHLSRTMPTDSAASESADNQEKAKEDLINAIKTEINSLERLVNKGLQDIALQAGIFNYEGRCEFNTKIDISNLDQQLREEMAYKSDAEKYSEWIKAQLIKAVNRQGYDEDVTARIVKQIENNEITQPKGINPPVTTQPPAITLNNV